MNLYIEHYKVSLEVVDVAPALYLIHSSTIAHTVFIIPAYENR
jgi:hypothetical protein